MRRGDPFRFEFDENGHLLMDGIDGHQEAVCVICGDRIQWCLDMFTFTTGERKGLAHARCVWMPSAFVKEMRRAERP